MVLVAFAFSCVWNSIQLAEASSLDWRPCGAVFSRVPRFQRARPLRRRLRQHGALDARRPQVEGGAVGTVVIGEQDGAASRLGGVAIDVGGSLALEFVEDLIIGE